MLHYATTSRQVCMIIAAFSLTCLPAAVLAETEEYIQVPSECAELVKSVPGEVYLSDDGSCEPLAFKKLFKIDSSRSEIKIHVNGSLWKSVVVSPLSSALADDVSARADKLAATIKLPDNEHKQEASARAGTILDAAFDERINSEIQRVHQSVLGGMLGGQYPDLAKVQLGQSGDIFKKDQRLYILVSASMPLETLRIYAAQVDALQSSSVRIITRGLVGGARELQPTMRWVLDVTRTDKSCDYLDDANSCEFADPVIDVDAGLFKRFDIERVPAFVFVNGVDSNGDWNEGDADAVPMGSAAVTLGDASLEVQLERLHAGTKAPELLAALKALKTSEKLNRFYRTAAK